MHSRQEVTPGILDENSNQTVITRASTETFSLSSSSSALIPKDVVSVVLWLHNRIISAVLVLS